METIKDSQVIFPNIKQSRNWEKYLNMLGWKSFRLSDGSLVLSYGTFFGAFFKVQKPSILDLELLVELDTICKSNKALFLKLEPAVAQDLSLLEKIGYKKNKNPLSPTVTMFIDLSKSDKVLWSNISRSGKYGINRGRREGTRVSFIKDPSEEDIKLFYSSVQLYTSHEKKFYIPNLSSLLSKCTVFSPNVYLSFYYDKKDVLCGGKVYLTYGDNVFYLHGGTTDEGAHNRGGFFQMWESILFFKKEGFKILDLDGIYDARFPIFTRGWLGFSRFKEKFGGTIIRYPHPYIKIYNPFLRFILEFLHMDI